eukprot:scaffold218466_cov36-Prasinocladus_malaysianus.AAC.1
MQCDTLLCDIYSNNVESLLMLPSRMHCQAEPSPTAPKVRLHFSTCIGPALLRRHSATAASLGAEICSGQGDDTFTHYITMMSDSAFIAGVPQEGKAKDGMGFIRSFKTLLALASGTRRDIAFRIVSSGPNLL